MIWVYSFFLTALYFMLKSGRNEGGIMCFGEDLRRFSSSWRHVLEQVLDRAGLCSRGKPTHRVSKVRSDSGAPDCLKPQRWRSWSKHDESAAFCHACGEPTPVLTFAQELTCLSGTHVCILWTLNREAHPSLNHRRGIPVNYWKMNGTFL